VDRGGEGGSPGAGEEAAFDRVRQAWRDRAPGKLVGRGHPIGDFLEAYDWDVLEEAEGLLRVRALLPRQVLNPRGQLFGGFTPTYVDFLALHAYRAGRGWDRAHGWLATLNMRLDYFEPVVGPTVEVECRVAHRRGVNAWIEVRFLGPEGTLQVLAFVTLREVG
jgi:acyl-coenzyme A thioesterase PaaI-like protein